jgi:chromate transporter
MRRDPAHWARLCALPAARAVMGGANAAVVGMLRAALYDPLLTGAIGDLRDFELALGCFVLPIVWKTPPWTVVALADVAGTALARMT